MGVRCGHGMGEPLSRETILGGINPASFVKPRMVFCRAIKRVVPTPRNDNTVVAKRNKPVPVTPWITGHSLDCPGGFSVASRTGASAGV